MVDREHERARLQEAATEAPGLVVLRGRRRVGKSYLLNKTFEDHRFVYFQADEGDEREHLDLLATEIGRRQGAPLSFPTWDEALRYVGTLATGDTPLVVALDEYQWMRAAQPSLDSTIMRHFDRWVRDGTRILLIVSGSALTLMEGLLEGDKPIFGRAAYRPLLKPFDFRDAADFAPHLKSAEDHLKRYAVLGGTAQYQVWAGKRSLESILKARILAKDESLFEEPLQLIRGEDEIREPGTYYAILRAVSQGRTRHNEIGAATKVTSSALLSQRLRRLEQLGYLQERRPLRGNGTASWALADPYFAFWFRYVYPARSRLQSGRIDEVSAQVLSDLDNFMGPRFEQVCRDWAATYATHQALDAEIGAYWTRTHDVEVDVIAQTKKTVTALGTCKWSKNADAHVLDELIHARDAITGAGQASLWVFARGFHRSLVQRASADESVHLVRADELYG